MAKIDEELKTRFVDDRHRCVANIIFTAGWIQGLFSEFLKPFGVSSQQFNILRILRGAKDWVSMNDIKRLMVEKSPNTTRLCDKLIDKELAIRERSDEDRRVVSLKITDKGLALLKAIDDSNDGKHNQFMTNLSKEDAVIVSEVLDKMRG